VIVVDSSVWIGHLTSRDRPAVRRFRSIPDPDKVLVGDLILLEVLRGARDEPHAVIIERELRQFRVESMLDPQLAAKAARHYRTLRAFGITVSKVPDLLIATYCIEHGHEILHDDKDFEPFVTRLGLRSIDV
jgi:predicted nucleic acid-binding protein